MTNNPSQPAGKPSIVWYYAGEDGKICMNGWYEINGKTYYFYAGGNAAVNSNFVLDGKRYYVDENGAKRSNGWFVVEGTYSNGTPYANWYYQQEDGSLLTDGWHEIDGVMKQGEWFVISGLDSRDSDYNNWYYALDNGNIVMDRWYKIDGKSYGFNSGGVMRTGWLTDSKLDENGDSESSYYYCGEDGARALGWHWLEIPENWIDDSDDVTDYVHDNGQYAWFYFNQSTGKKRRSSGGKKETNVDGVTYCFDGNGIMYPGWVKLSSKTPEISGYRYFYQPESETDKKFIAGQKVEGSWLYINGPADLNGSGQKEWFYFEQSGEPVHAAENKYKRKEIHNDIYVFDMYGAAQYGLVEISGVSSSEDGFYYCGSAEGNRKCVKGKVMLDDGLSSGKSQYYFDNDGRGYTGTKDGYLYYNGKLQKADKAAKYEVFQLETDGRKYLVNSSGKVMKNTKVTDGNDQKWAYGERLFGDL